MYLSSSLRPWAPNEGDAPTGILRAVEEYVTASAKRTGRRPGKYRQLVRAQRTPVADLHLSARPASALRALDIRYVYELVARAPTDLRRQRNVGEQSLREVKARLATLGLTLGMPLEEDTYRAAVVAAVAASIEAPRGGGGS
jgi:DNA-directed RNA polymerase alpha subunit